MAEAQKAPCFRAILSTLARGSGAAAVAFLIDEFEEIGLQKRLTKRAAHDYLSTLKPLINLAGDKDNPFWVFLSMPPDAHRTTLQLEPALVERFAEQANVLRLDALGQDDAQPWFVPAWMRQDPRTSGVETDDVCFRFRTIRPSVQEPAATPGVSSRYAPLPSPLPMKPPTCRSRRST